MKKFEIKQKELTEQSEYWNTVLTRPRFSEKNPEFKKLCYVHAAAIDLDLEEVTALNTYVKNNYR